MIRRRLFLVLLAGLLFGSLAQRNTVAASAPPRWGEPVSIGEQIPSSWFPDIQADPTGAFRLVWTSNLAEGDGNLTHALTGAVMFAQLTNSGWGAPRDIQVMDAGIASRPLIASDGTYAHLLFRTGTLGTVRLFYARAPLTADLGNAHSWSAPRAISDNEAYYARIAILPDGALVVLYNAIAPAGLLAAATPQVPPRPGPPATPAGTPQLVDARRTVVFARRSSDHGQNWDFPTLVSASEQRIGRTTLAVAPDGQTLIAAWDEGYDNLTGQGDPLGAGTALSLDGGATWQARQAIRSPRGPIEQASVALGRDAPLLVYRATTEDRLLYRTGLDGGRRWSEERPVPGALARPYTSKHNFDSLGLVADGDGRLLLAYVGQDSSAPKGLAVMVATFAGGEWTPPERVAAPDGYPEYPRLAVALGNRLQLVFFVRDKQFDIGHYVLYAVAGQSDARAVAPVFPPPAPPPAPLAPTVVIPAVRLNPVPTIPIAPAPLPPGGDRLWTPQAEVNEPALRALWVTLLALVLAVTLLGLHRWLRATDG